MTLSDAIRLGSMLHPQGFRLLSGVDSDGIRYTCALGAAADAVGDVYDLTRLFGKCLSHYTKPPYDAHSWTREAIADWVESVEKAMEATKEAPTEDQSLTTQEVTA